MPDDLDPTTARLVSELSALILPSLTKSLSSAIPAIDFAGAAERMNRTAQDLRSDLVKAVRSEIDDSRAGRSMIMQSIGSVIEEISALRKNIDALPQTLEALTARIKLPEINNAPVPDEIMSEIEGISQRIDTLTQGIKAFFETYAENIENNNQGKNEILRPSFDSEALSGIEGLIRAESKSHANALAELSRELSSMTEENNTALIHEVREAVSSEISGIIEGGNNIHSSNNGGSSKLLKITAGLSGACLILLLINIIMLILK